jgi:hypothetical protein
VTTGRYHRVPNEEEAMHVIRAAGAAAVVVLAAAVAGAQDAAKPPEAPTFESAAARPDELPAEVKIVAEARKRPEFQALLAN